MSPIFPQSQKSAVQLTMKGLNLDPEEKILLSFRKKGVKQKGRTALKRGRYCIHTVPHFKLVWCQVWISWNIIYFPFRNDKWQHIMSYCHDIQRVQSSRNFLQPTESKAEHFDMTWGSYFLYIDMTTIIDTIVSRVEEKQEAPALLFYHQSLLPRKLQTQKPAL